tara:strand:- start:363 stop:617 length:255 start_codon:yes stop_codon:yes gene_type:complete
MKGKMSEVLMVCGVYLYANEALLGSILLVLGVTCGFVRFTLEAKDKKVKNDIILGFHNIVSSISRAANSLENQKSHENNQTTVH